MDSLRKLPFVLALVAIALVVGIELGLSLLTSVLPDEKTIADALFDERIRAEEKSDNKPDADQRREIREDAEAQAKEIAGKPARPGMGIPYLAFVDGLVLFTALMMGASLIIPERVWGRVHGVVRLIVMIVIIFAAILLIVLALVMLLLRFGLFIAAPFGTLAYIAIWGFFDRGGAQVTLSMLLGLKIAFGVLLLLAQQRFALHKGMVALFLSSLLANVIVSFLHGLVPRVMVSITDALAAVVLGIFGAIWALIMAIGALVAVVKSIRLEKEAA